MAKQSTKHRPKKVTAKKTTQAAKPALKKVAVSPKPAPVMLSAKLPNVLQLGRQSAQTLWLHKTLFAGIAAIYGVLNIIFVSGAGSGIDVTTVRNQFGSHLVGSLAAYTQLLSSPSGGSSQASAYRLILFIMGSLAIVWALRQTHAGATVRIRDAYYEGMYPLVPCLLVLLIVGLQFIPLIVGSSVYQLVVSNGVAATTIEVIIWGLFAFGMALVSLYFVTATLFGFYIATLPDMPPVKAWQLARKLVKGRRWSVLRKILFLPLVLIVITAILLLPLILLIPRLAPLLLLIITPLLLTLSHSYLYSLYRGLMNE